MDHWVDNNDVTEQRRDSSSLLLSESHEGGHVLIYVLVDLPQLIAARIRRTQRGRHKKRSGVWTQ